MGGRPRRRGSAPPPTAAITICRARLVASASTAETNRPTKSSTRERMLDSGEADVLAICDPTGESCLSLRKVKSNLGPRATVNLLCVVVTDAPACVRCISASAIYFVHLRVVCPLFERSSCSRLSSPLLARLLSTLACRFSIGLVRTTARVVAEGVRCTASADTERVLTVFAGFGLLFVAAFCVGVLPRAVGLGRVSILFLLRWVVGENHLNFSGGCLFLAEQHCACPAKRSNGRARAVHLATLGNDTPPPLTRAERGRQPWIFRAETARRGRFAGASEGVLPAGGAEYA